MASNIYMVAGGTEELFPIIVAITVGVIKFVVDMIKEEADLPEGG